MSCVFLVQADARQIPLKDSSVHCCVTSPPYFNLRDYGTATWHGGTSLCPHTLRQISLHKDPSSTINSRATNQNHEREPSFPKLCVLCGATRIDQQIGLEAVHDCLAWARQEQPCAACYVCAMRAVFAEVWRVLRDDGTLWIIIGDTYASSWPCSRRNEIGAGSLPCGKREARPPRLGNGLLKNKDLMGIPWRVAFALQADGWTLRSDIIWSKANCMPESVNDRPTMSHEYVFLFSKQTRYFYDAVAIMEETTDHEYRTRGKIRPPTSLYCAPRQDGSHRTAMSLHQQPGGRLTRNIRNVWTILTEPFPGAHFACMPTALAARCIQAGTSAHGVCSLCGAPYRRLIASHDAATPRYKRKTLGEPHDPSDSHTLRTAHYISTVGWEPSCSCAAMVVPAVVFDPFAGASTTLLVARDMGRHGVGMDLSWRYLQLSRERLQLTALAAWTGTPRASRPVDYTDLPLFGPGEGDTS